MIEEEEYGEESLNLSKPRAAQNNSDSDTFNMQDEDDEEDDDNIIDIQLESNSIEVNYAHLIKYSQEIREKYTEPRTAQDELPRLLSDYQKKYQIKERNIIIFLNFTQNKCIDIDNYCYCDLYKLAQLFKVFQLTKILNKFAQEHSKDVSFMSKIIGEQQLIQNFGSFYNKKNISEIENNLSNQIDECFDNEFFNQLPISIVLPIIEKSNRELIKDDSLYDFIAKSVEDRHVLFHFIDIEKLSDDRLHDILKNFEKENRKQSNQRFYGEIGKLVKYFMMYKDCKNGGQSEIDRLIEENKELSNSIEEQERLSFQYQEDKKIMSTEVEKIEKYIDELKEKIVNYEYRLDEKRNNEKESQNFSDLIKEFLQFDDDIKKFKISGKTLLHLACELGNIELFKYFLSLEIFDITSKTISINFIFNFVFQFNSF